MDLMIGLAGIGAVLVLLVIGMPIGMALALAALAGSIVLGGVGQAWWLAALKPYSVVAIYILTVVPMFILMGHFAFMGRISDDMYSAAYKWVGSLPGGLAMATVAGCAGFAACTGISSATAATMGKVALPQMKKFGYDDKLATGSVAAGGLLGGLIPPSVPLVIYAFLTEESIGKLLIAAIIPGFFTAAVFMAGIFLRAKVNPKLGPPGPRVSWKERIVAAKGAWGVLLLFLIVIGGIYGGVLTATEAASAGAFVAFIIALARMRGERANFIKDALADTLRITCMVFTIIVGASLFTIFMAYSGISTWLAESVIELPVPPLAILILLMAMYIPLGMFLDTMSMMLLTLPIVYPAVVALGFNSIWFAILLVKLIEIGQLSPPLGMNVFIVKGIAPDVPIEDIFRGIVPFIFLEIVIIGILMAVPQMSLWLPSTMFLR